MNQRPTPNFPLSYSKLSGYLSCPLKFDTLNVSKIYKFESNKHMDRGTRIHKEFENYVKYGKSLSEESYPFKKNVDEFLSLEGKKVTEKKLAFTKDYTPCDFFDNDKADYRSATDLLIIKGDRITNVDYKSGKVHDEVELEMLMFAILIFVNYPEVNKVRNILCYFDQGENKIDIRSREDLPRLIEIYENTAAPLWDSLITGSFKPTRNGLCKWCQHQSQCPSFGG